MRPARQFIVGDLISGIFDLFLTTLGGRGRCRAGPDGSSCKHLRGAHCAAAGCVDKKSRFAVLCHHKLYLESEPLDIAYVLQHSYETDGCEETKFIGVYRSREAADLAI